MYAAKQQLRLWLGSVSHAWFKLRLRYYTRKYGGINNIPHDVVGSLLLDHSEDDNHCLEMMNALIAFEKTFFSLTGTHTKTALWRYANNLCSSQAEEDALRKWCDTPRKRHTLVDSLVRHNDLEAHQHDYYREQIADWIVEETL